MIGQAKVNASAVKAFEQSVSTTRDYSPRLDKGIQCLEMLLALLHKAEKKLDDAIAKATQELDSLSERIYGIEEQINSLNARVEQLESKLDDLETKLEHTQENGDLYGELTVSDKIDEVNSEICSIQNELSLLNERLDQANSIYSRLESHTDAMDGVAYSLAEKENTCRRLIDELTTVQHKNRSQGASATESLKKIQTIIANYLHIKMEYEEMSVAASALESNYGVNNQINVNINIHKISFIQTEPAEEETFIKQTTEAGSAEPESIKATLLSEQEITDHNVKLDDSGRITLYDGKTFGGEFNSYETRLMRTSVDDNPMLGHYEGERGESKFIPSNRTAEGIIITEILGKYGIDGIIYRNAEPDFEVCSEAVVKIQEMTENRENYSNADGIIVMGNFTQADMQLAEEWNRERRDDRDDWLPRDVYDYRKANRLTWHEKCDMETMVLVRYEINLFFKHSGGCSECRTRDSVSDNGGGFDE